MRKLLVYQSMWAMERRRPDGAEWTLERKLEMIRDAGFDGAGVRFADYHYAKTVRETYAATGTGTGESAVATASSTSSSHTN